VGTQNLGRNFGAKKTVGLWKMWDNSLFRSPFFIGSFQNIFPQVKPG
jgi:hypothetical protein